MRCKRTGRLGRVGAIIRPARSGGRDVLVEWSFQIDYSIVRRDEIEDAPDAKMETWARGRVQSEHDGDVAS